MAQLASMKQTLDLIKRTKLGGYKCSESIFCCLKTSYYKFKTMTNKWECSELNFSHIRMAQECWMMSVVFCCAGTVLLALLPTYGCVHKFCAALHCAF